MDNTMLQQNEQRVTKGLVRVFISYCHESDDFDKLALGLSNRLVNDGINSMIDQYVQSPPEGWLAWMLTQIKEADFVLILCTKKYYEKSVLAPSGNGGRGTRFESMISFNEMYANYGYNKKFIPLILTDTDEPHIPEPLQPYDFYNLSSDKGYEKLYRRITSQPLVVKPRLGDVKDLSAGVTLSSAVSDSISNTAADAGSPVQKMKETEVKKSPISVDIRIDDNIEKFSNEQQAVFLKTLNDLLALHHEVKVIYIKAGSVILGLQMEYEDYEKLIEAYRTGKLQAMKVLDVRAVAEEKATVAASASMDEVKAVATKVSAKATAAVAGKKAGGTSIETITKSLVELTVKDVQELAELLKTEYGIEPAAAAVVVSTSGSTENKETEKTTFDVILKSGGAAKLNVVKIVKDISGLGLKEAKDLVDGAPSTVKTGVDKAEAEEIKKKLDKAGADVEIS